MRDAFGSGFLTRNVSCAFRPGIPRWATEFDAWAEDALARCDVDALLDFEKRAPAARTARSTWEHSAPLLAAAGAAAHGRPRGSTSARIGRARTAASVPSAPPRPPASREA